MDRDNQTVGRRVLVAGIGNIFFGDDGFGVEVARRLASMPVPAGVRVADFGTRGLHLACEMLDGGYEEVIFVDAMPHGAAPGTVVLMEPDAGAARAAAADEHAMTPDAVLQLLHAIGGRTPRVLIVGCEPRNLEPGIGLSSDIAAAVDRAARTVLDLVTDNVHARVSGNPRTTRLLA